MWTQYLWPSVGLTIPALLHYVASSVKTCPMLSYNTNEISSKPSTKINASSQPLFCICYKSIRFIGKIPNISIYHIQFLNVKSTNITATYHIHLVYLLKDIISSYTFFCSSPHDVNFCKRKISIWHIICLWLGQPGGQWFARYQGPLLLTWFNFNPSMYK